MIGKRIGKYKIQAEIGRGGMGVVYKALQTSLGRTVALKMLPPQMALSREFLERFQREARLLARLAHRNIVHIYDLEQHGGTYYIVMEYVDGHSLAESIRTSSPLPFSMIKRVGQEVSSALAAAHAAGVIHRDIKPENIMVDRFSEVKVMDFGIARAADESFKTRAGIRLGTPEYMSPEQAKGLEVGAQSDLYSLGIVLYEMLTGKVPFSGSDSIAIALKHINEPLVPPSRMNPSIPAALEKAVLQLLEKDRRNRIADAAAARKAFEALALPEEETPPPAAEAMTFMFCPECGVSLRADFLRCPECGRVVRRQCPFCGGLFDAIYSVCPHCSRELPSFRPEESPQTVIEAAPPSGGATAASPGNRSPAASAFPEALKHRAAALAENIRGRIPGWTARMREVWERLRRKPLLLAAGAGGLLVLILALILFSGNGAEKYPPPPQGGGNAVSGGGGTSAGGGGTPRDIQNQGARETAGDNAALLGLSRDYFERGAFDLCIAEIQKILRSNPDHAEARALLERASAVKDEVAADLQKARSALQQKAYGRCLETCDRILLISPKHPQALEMRDIALAQYPQYAEEAENRNRIQAVINRQKTGIETENADLLARDVSPELYMQVKQDSEAFFTENDIIEVQFDNVRINIQGTTAEVTFSSMMVFRPVDTGRERRERTTTHWKLLKTGTEWKIIAY